MNIPSPRGTRRARIEIIPLIDIVFFLLATFVMVSLSMIQNKGIAVNLPVATTGAPQENAADYTTLSVTETGEYYFNKEPVTLVELTARLKSLKERESDPRLFIHGDRKAEFGKAVAVLDEARKLGISKVSIETAHP